MKGYRRFSVGMVMVLGALLTACGKEDVSGDAEPVLTSKLASEGRELVQTICAGCHAPDDKGALSRIAGARKSPEGWEMTVVRMMNFHGLELTTDQRRAIVKYLADIQGLAPSEAEPFRYALERRANIFEEVKDENLQTMCARCHSFARVGLQRRGEEEWRKLVNMHVGQWPTIEYQMLSRDRDWYEEALGPVSKTLASLYPKNSKAWGEWVKAKKPNPEGRWRVVTYMPGRGPDHSYIDGISNITSKGDDGYDIAYEVAQDGNNVLAGKSSSMIYTGYEWRGTGKFDGRTFREVATVSEDGETLSGRWFWSDAPELGGYIQAVRMDRNVSRIMGINGEAVKRGETATVTVLGVGLSGDVDLGAGLTVETVSATPEKIVLRVSAAADADIGRRDIKVGKTQKASAVSVYDEIQRVEITPDYAVSRVGGGGGHLAPVSAQYEAIAWHNGKDGKPNTKDDFRIGAVAADWHTEPADENAVRMKDHLFAGKITPQGLFLPSPAGPNPQRIFGAGNLGDLHVIATVSDGDKDVVGKARLIVTAQKWNNPPIY